MVVVIVVVVDLDYVSCSFRWVLAFGGGERCSIINFYGSYGVEHGCSRNHLLAWAWKLECRWDGD